VLQGFAGADESRDFSRGWVLSGSGCVAVRSAKCHEVLAGFKTQIYPELQDGSRILIYLLFCGFRHFVSFCNKASTMDLWMMLALGLPA